MEIERSGRDKEAIEIDIETREIGMEKVGDKERR